jgi:hypothetical protein
MKNVGADPERLLKRLPLELNFPAGRAATFRMRLPRLPAPLHLAVRPARRARRQLRREDRGGALHALSAERRLLPRRRLHGQHAARSPSQHGPLRRYLWESLCLAALNTSPQQASAQIFVNTLRDSLGGGRAATDLLLPAADLEQPVSGCGGELHCRARRADPPVDAYRDHRRRFRTRWRALRLRTPRRRPATRGALARPAAGNGRKRTAACRLRLRADRHRLLRLFPAAAPAFPDARPGGAGQRPDRAVGLRSRSAVRHAGSDRLRAQRPWRLGGTRQADAGRAARQRTVGSCTPGCRRSNGNR